MPTDRTAELVAAIASGARLAAGDYAITPPLFVRPGDRLLGPGWGHATVRSIDPLYRGPLIEARWVGYDGTVAVPGDSDSTNGLRQTVIEGIRIHGSGLLDANHHIMNGQSGIVVNAPNVRIRDVEVYNCEHGIDLCFAVDVSIDDCSLRGNTVNLYAPGPTVNATRITRCQIRDAWHIGAYIKAGRALAFTSPVFEHNALISLRVEPGGGPLTPVIVNHPWFEDTPTHIAPGFDSPLVQLRDYTIATGPGAGYFRGA